MTKQEAERQIDKDGCVAIMTDLVDKASWYSSAIELNMELFGDDLYERAMKALGREIVEPEPYVPAPKVTMTDDQLRESLRAVGKAALNRHGLELEQARERVRQLEASQP